MARNSPISSFWAVAAVALGVALGGGCAGGGCSGFSPLPTGPAPFNLPSSQLIEGGIQARLTKPGLDKLMKPVVDLVKTALGPGICLIKEQDLFQTVANCNHLVACNQKPAGCSPSTGCAAKLILDSKDRPNMVQDNADGVDISVTGPQTLKIKIGFDVDFPLLIDYGVGVKVLGSCVGTSGTCNFDIYNDHYKGNSATPIKLSADIVLGISPTTGELTLTLGGLNIDSIDIQASGCGVIGTLAGLGLSALDALINTGIGNTLLNFLTNLLVPTINKALQALLPQPLGLAGQFDVKSLLASFKPAHASGIEMFLVPGGYVQTSNGGLTLGVMTGINSDRDATTRDPANVSEPSLCVPARPAPALGAAPWSLPANAARQDFTLKAAGEFAGMPEPTGPAGALQDLAIGVSRTFLDLVGFHLFSSGSLCLTIDGSGLPQLNGGTLSLLAPSLASIIEDPRAPLSLVLRPQQPLIFTLGTGTTASPLVNLQIADLRIDFYAWIEERFVRIFTLGLDVNVGLNLAVTKNAMMQPVITPMLVGIEPSQVTLRALNTDLLSEAPADLEKALPAVVGIALSALGGTIPGFGLPSVAGISLSDITVARAQTGMDDFLGIYATLAPGAPAPLVDWSDPQHPHLAGEVRAEVAVQELFVPSPEAYGQLLAPAAANAVSPRPHVKLALSTKAPSVGLVEYSWRIDGGFWHPYSVEREPVIEDEAFLLQGRHQIEVRARSFGRWETEDSDPPEDLGAHRLGAAVAAPGAGREGPQLAPLPGERPHLPPERAQLCPRRSQRADQRLVEGRHALGRGRARVRQRRPGAAHRARARRGRKHRSRRGRSRALPRSHDAIRTCAGLRLRARRGAGRSRPCARCAFGRSGRAGAPRSDAPQATSRRLAREPGRPARCPMLDCPQVLHERTQ